MSEYEIGFISHIIGLRFTPEKIKKVVCSVHLTIFTQEPIVREIRGFKFTFCSKECADGLEERWEKVLERKLEKDSA